MEKYKYKFSVIIPVYNVEDYLEETLESVINQSIGFKDNIQIVLINDGSPDNSEEICLKYKDLYPDNIVYFKQKNAGVSVARNKGIELAEGLFSTMLDSDDKWSSDAFKQVYDHYLEHPDINVFSCKMVFFDAKDGDHPLNYKFVEDKIVDICKDYNYPQLSSSSLFVKTEVLKKHRYTVGIKYSEDNRLINEILLEVQKMMVLKDPVYLYRKRPDQSSALQNSVVTESWYTVTPKKAFAYLMDESKKKYGKILEYFQYLTAYDLGWRINVPVKKGVLDDKQKKEYINTINDLISKIDIKYFREQRHISPTRVLFFLKLKEKIDVESQLVQKDHDIYLDCVGYNKEDAIVFIRVDDLYYRDGKIHIYGRFNSSIYDKNKIYLNINGEFVKPEFYETRTNYDEVAFNDDYINKSLGIRCEIDVKDLKNFSFHYGKENDYIDLRFSSYSMITHLLDGSYFTFDDKMLTYDKGKFTLMKKGFFKMVGRELKNIKGFIARRKFKFLLNRYFVILTQIFGKKNVWLLSDRVNMADDNAEHLFKYLNKYHKKDVNAYYVISEKSKDFERMKQYGKVVSNSSFKYKLLFHNAKYIVSSHAEGYITNIYGKSNMYYRDLFHYNYVFLQHGITKDDISSWLNPNTKHMDMFVSAVPLEYKSLQINGYADNVVQLTGFPRYDGLVENSKKYKTNNTILMSFTWRNSLASTIDQNTGERIYNEGFKESNYYKWINSLLKNQKLHKFLKENDFKIRYVPHPNVLCQIKDFNFDDDVVTLVRNNVNYQKEFSENKLLITDFSSIFFDFAYLKKPIIYYQPDLEEFYSDQVYDKGYFDYEKMGFGPVIEDEDKLVDEIIKCIKNNCSMSKKYEKRIDDFFEYNDNKNCERVYNAIINIDSKR